MSSALTALHSASPESTACSLRPSARDLLVRASATDGPMRRGRLGAAVVAATMAVVFALVAAGVAAGTLEVATARILSASR